ncbi:MAG TPA: Holliday junction branch migration protein RuvA [Phycisphaerae bacterium]|nr:Holliday junction branch migration protein RuvA [Phycisphaerae bacterium]
MIVRMSGLVAEVHPDRAVIDRDGVAYEVLVCGYAIGELTICLGRQTTLHTLEYFEGSTMGGNLIPRLVGFLHPQDRTFFEKFITVKGMGVRKAIKALAEPVGRVAAAIEAGDERVLSRLPGVGKRLASQIIAELKGKVTNFALDATEKIELPGDAAESWTPDMRDALEVLCALGEKRADAQRWVERGRQLHPETTGSDEWVRLAYRIRSTSEM